MREWLISNWKWLVTLYLAIGVVMGVLVLNTSAEIRQRGKGKYPYVGETDRSYAVAMVLFWGVIIPFGLLAMACELFDMWMNRHGYHPMEWVFLWPMKIKILRMARKETENGEQKSGADRPEGKEAEEEA